MARKNISKNDSFDKRDDDEMEELGENEKEFNPDSLDDALEEENDFENEDDESLDSLEEEEEELNERDMTDEEDSPFWKL